MKQFILSLSLLFCARALLGQMDTLIETGTASYVSSQNVYVKFASTENIRKGDTLFSKTGDLLTPSLLVKDKSSTSCVCSSFLTEKVKIGAVFYARSIVEKKPEKTKEKEQAKAQKPAAPAPPAGPDSLVTPPLVRVPGAEDREDPVYKQKIKGRISAASYSNFSDGDESHRMRYTLTFQGNNLKNSRFSTDNYISFRHTLGEWQQVRDNFNNALKIYSLSVKYDLDKTSHLTLGRKINMRISSMGAIDGLQAEKGLKKHFFVGAIAGSRPDYADYSINFNLLQAGAYIGHATRKEAKSQESTLAFVEQRNHSSTDRRFVYFQHSNALLKNLSLFASFEVDLYRNVDSVISTAPSLTNMLLSLRYKISKKLNVSAAYDNRKNIIYYESYKNFIDQLIDDETRQGLRFGVNYRFSKTVNLGVNTSWRFQKSDINLSKNLNSYLNFNRLPWIKATASLSANILQTAYLNSAMYGARIAKELVRGKLNGEVYVRRVEYDYKNYENKIRQEIAGLDLSWNITKKLAFYIYYEGTFDKQTKTFHRFNSRIIQRF